MRCTFPPYGLRAGLMVRKTHPTKDFSESSNHRDNGLFMPNWAKVYLGDSRAMTEVEDGGIDLAVTSPPYWHIKDYGVPGQIGYGQSLHEYLKDLYRAWRECFRVLREGAPAVH